MQIEIDNANDWPELPPPRPAPPSRYERVLATEIDEEERAAVAEMARYGMVVVTDNRDGTLTYEWPQTWQARRGMYLWLRRNEPGAEQRLARISR